MQCAAVRLRYQNAGGARRSKVFAPPNETFDPKVAKVMAEIWAKSRIKKGTVVEESMEIEPCSGEIQIYIVEEWGYYDDLTFEITYRCSKCNEVYVPQDDSAGAPFLPTDIEHIEAVINGILSAINTPEDFVRHVP